MLCVHVLGWTSDAMAGCFLRRLLLVTPSPGHCMNQTPFRWFRQHSVRSASYIHHRLLRCAGAVITIQLHCHL